MSAEGVGWIYLPKVMIQWWDLVNRIMNSFAHNRQANFLTS
jgi:hypothetical protein